MAVDQIKRSNLTDSLSLDSSTFTYQPKINELSNKIAQSFEDDFYSRQLNHINKQRYFIRDAVVPDIGDLERIEENEDIPVAKEDMENTMNSLRKTDSLQESKISQMISASPYSKDPIMTKRRYQSKPDIQRSSKLLTDTSALPQREASTSPVRPSISKSRTMPSFATSHRSETAHSVERLQRAQEMVAKAIAEKKVFCIAGTYHPLRESLRQRGWVEKFCFQNGASTGVTQSSQTSSGDCKTGKCSVSKSRPKTTDSSDSDSDCDCDFDDEEDLPRVPPWEEDSGFYGMMSRMLKNYLPNFVFTTKMSSIDYKNLQKDQIVNHYAKNGCLTTKNGLCLALRGLPWYEPVDPNVFFPRCYRISSDDEKLEFIDDFRLSACQATIKWVLEHHYRFRDSSEEDSSISSGEGKETRPTKGKKGSAVVPTKLLDWAVQQCEKFLVEREHGFLDVIREPHTLTDTEWNQLLEWYYQLVHHNGRLASLESHSLVRLNSLAERLGEAQAQFHMDGWRNVWIVKPGAKSRGRGVQCLTRLDDITRLVSSGVIREGKYVVQKYIERPLLVHSTKFDIRQWFVVTDWNPLTMWFYSECYIRLCSQPFSLDSTSQAIHLSNNAIQANYSNSKDRSSELPSFNMWTSKRFKQYLADELNEPTAWDDLIYPGMRQAIVWALEACQDVVAPRKNSFELFGADFMLTDDLQPWLIEVNCSPCLASSTPVTARMCPQVQEDLLKLVLDRRSDKHCYIGMFELGCRQPVVTAPNYLGLSLAVEGQNYGRSRNAVSLSRQPAPPPRLSRSLSVDDGGNQSSGGGDSSDNEEPTSQRLKPTVVRFSTQRKAPVERKSLPSSLAILATPSMKVTKKVEGVTRMLSRRVAADKSRHTAGSQQEFGDINAFTPAPRRHSGQQPKTPAKLMLSDGIPKVAPHYMFSSHQQLYPRLPLGQHQQPTAPSHHRRRGRQLRRSTASSPSNQLAIIDGESGAAGRTLVPRMLLPMRAPERHKFPSPMPAAAAASRRRSPLYVEFNESSAPVSQAKLTQEFITPPEMRPQPDSPQSASGDNDDDDGADNDDGSGEWRPAMVARRQPVTLAPFKFNRTKKAPPRVHRSSSAGKARRNLQAVVNIMTYHPPLPTRRVKPPLSFSANGASMPGRVLVPNVSSTLDAVLQRARNTIAVAKALANETKRSNVLTWNQQARQRALAQMATASSYFGEPPGNDDDDDDEDDNVEGDGGEGEGGDSGYSVEMYLPPKAAASKLPGKSRAKVQRSMFVSRDPRGSLFSPVRKVALSFEHFSTNR